MFNKFAHVNRPVNVEWIIAGDIRKEAADLAKFDAAWELANAEFLATGKADWPVPPAAEVPFVLPFEAPRKGRKNHRKGARK
jgi:hypothetical protein